MPWYIQPPPAHLGRLILPLQCRSGAPEAPDGGRDPARTILAEEASEAGGDLQHGRVARLGQGAHNVQLWKLCRLETDRGRRSGREPGAQIVGPQGSGHHVPSGGAGSRGGRQRRRSHRLGERGSAGNSCHEEAALVGHHAGERAGFAEVASRPTRSRTPCLHANERADKNSKEIRALQFDIQRGQRVSNMIRHRVIDEVHSDTKHIKDKCLALEKHIEETKNILNPFAPAAVPTASICAVVLDTGLIVQGFNKASRRKRPRPSRLPLMTWSGTSRRFTPVTGGPGSTYGSRTRPSVAGSCSCGTGNASQCEVFAVRSGPHSR